ncbi:hypothetical protein CPB86DRAFT_818989 [Serendipita vermifera]|nr:hypothetical protein CPB86DRAFT_818989 [Serendipita vermifera]
MLTRAKSVRKASNEKFPTEVLREIFLYLEDEEAINHVLSLVCRMWRMVTITVPQLWTHIWLIPNDESVPRSTFIPRLTLLRKRAGKELLHIKWNLTPVHDVRDFYARFTYCVSQATPMERWKSLDVIDGAFAPSTYHMVRSNAYKLERVGIFTEDICVRSIIDLLNISDARPRILETNARPPFTMSYTMRRPYCRLRELHGTYVSAPALNYMPILDTVSAVELEGGWYETHYSLRVLRIRTITDYQLRRIKTPYLEELEIKFLKAEKPLMIKFPKLRKLKLTLGVFSPMYLFCVPQLENLHIDALKCPYGVSDSRLSGVLEQPKYALDPRVLKLNVKLSIPVIHSRLEISLI